MKASEREQRRTAVLVTTNLGLQICEELALELQDIPSASDAEEGRNDKPLLRLFLRAQSTDY